MIKSKAKLKNEIMQIKLDFRVQVLENGYLFSITYSPKPITSFN
jgi:hypothetical protein